MNGITILTETIGRIDISPIPVQEAEPLKTLFQINGTLWELVGYIECMRAIPRQIKAYYVAKLEQPTSKGICYPLRGGAA